MSKESASPSASLPAPVGTHHVDHLEKLERSMEQLDAHIARLALALGLSLDDPLDLSRAMNDHAPAQHGPSASATRDDRLHAQLRGLLTMRYELMQRCAEELGPELTLQLMAEAESHLVALGFKPGADGIHLDQLRPVG